MTAPSLRIDALSAGDVDDAAELVAREHRHVCERGVPLPAGFVDAAECGAALVELLAAGYTGFIARRGTQAVGVMCGRTLDGVGFVPAHGLALDVSVPGSGRVVAEMFAELACVLVAEGAGRLTVDQIDDERLALALFDLGFGRGGVFAVRSTEAIEFDSAIEVRIGTAADLESITALGHVEFLERSAPPMYGFAAARSLADTRAAHERLLDDGAVRLLARRAGRDVGLLTIEHTSPAPRLCDADSPYIGPTATVPEVRGSGVGRALVASSLGWARAEGHDMISVDFDARSLVSRPFWIGNGFRPTGYRLRRVLGH